MRNKRTQDVSEHIEIPEDAGERHPSIAWLGDIIDNPEDSIFIIELVMSTYQKGSLQYQELLEERRLIEDRMFEEVFL